MSRSSHGAVAVVGARRGRWLALALGACSLVAAVAVSVGASAAAVEPTTVILGQTASIPDPACPELPCQAVGSVTGFGVSNGQTRNPYLVPHDGRIKAWTLTLAQPTSSQRSFFNGFFGTPPQARISILRRVPGTNPPHFTLRAQSAVKVLSPYLGQTVKFGSNLKVERNDIVALTVPTWAPAFAQDLPANNVWRASREVGGCVDETAIRQGEAQQKVGKRAEYGCKYSKARLLYTATLVEEK